MPLPRHTLSLAAEYAVASELCRRGIYTQLTLGNLKRTDLLALTEHGNVARIEVKAKQGNTWPGCKGVNGKHAAIVFVDFKDKEDLERPDFYVLDPKEWRKLLRFKQKRFNKTHEERQMHIENNVPIIESESGKPYVGTTVRVDNVSRYKDAWQTIENILKS